MKPRLLSCVKQWPGCSEGDHNSKCCRFPKSCSCTVYPPTTNPALLEAPSAMSPPNPCRSCGTALQHCLEMRNDRILSKCGTYCCAPCADGTSQHAGSPPPNVRTTAELRPGDRVRMSGSEVRTVQARMSQDFNDWHALYFEDPGGTRPLWSQSTDPWEVLPPLPTQPSAALREYAVRNAQGEIFPMPSRDFAQHVAEGSPDLQAVSRTVPPWEVLR